MPNDFPVLKCSLGFPSFLLKISYVSLQINKKAVHNSSLYVSVYRKPLTSINTTIKKSDDAETTEVSSHVSCLCVSQIIVEN